MTNRTLILGLWPLLGLSLILAVSGWGSLKPLQVSPIASCVSYTMYQPDSIVRIEEAAWLARLEASLRRASPVEGGRQRGAFVHVLTIQNVDGREWTISVEWRDSVQETIFYVGNRRYQGTGLREHVAEIRTMHGI
ncbi:MAG: hypothetical protein AAF488_02450 [Planctomycetota bacterium]